jgi:hypothetical protein
MSDDKNFSDDIYLLDREQVTSPVVAGVAAAWGAARGNLVMAPKQAIDAFALRPWLPYIVLTELYQDPFRVRYRLVGTALVEANKQDYTGIWLAESGWDQETIDLNMSLYQRLAETRAPIFGMSKVKWDMRLKYRFEWALFPLSEDGVMVTHCLGVDDYSAVDRNLVLQRPEE